MESDYKSHNKNEAFQCELSHFHYDMKDGPQNFDISQDPPPPPKGLIDLFYLQKFSESSPK